MEHLFAQSLLLPIHNIHLRSAPYLLLRSSTSPLRKHLKALLFRNNSSFSFLPLLGIPFLHLCFQTSPFLISSPPFLHTRLFHFSSSSTCLPPCHVACLPARCLASISHRRAGDCARRHLTPSSTLPVPATLFPIKVSLLIASPVTLPPPRVILALLFPSRLSCYLMLAIVMIFSNNKRHIQQHIQAIQISPSKQQQFKTLKHKQKELVGSSSIGCCYLALCSYGSLSFSTFIYLICIYYGRSVCLFANLSWYTSM